MILRCFARPTASSDWPTGEVTVEPAATNPLSSTISGAPLIVEDNGFVAAGSTVTSPVGQSELAVGRAKQRNIKGWKRPEKSKK